MDEDALAEGAELDSNILSQEFALVRSSYQKFTKPILKPTGHVIIADPFDAFYDYDCPSDHRLTTNSVLPLVEQAARGVIVEMIGPVPYREHWAHSKTVTYDTMLMTVKGQD